MTDTNTRDASTMKLPRLARDFHASELVVSRATGTAWPMRLEFTLSSEQPVERWFGTEVLSHAPEAVDLSRAEAKAMPLLFNHDWNDPIGMVEVLRLADGRTKAQAVLFGTARAQEVGQMVDGGLRNVSVGYEILQMTEDTKRNVFTATRWMPLEASIVTVPADITVGIGRSAEEGARDVRVLRIPSQPAAPAAPKEKATMADTTAAAGANAEQGAAQEQQTRAAAQPIDHGQRGLELERNRRRGIENLCKANKIDDSVRDYWIGSGLSMDAVSDDLLKIMEERGKANPQSDAKLGLTQKETQQYSLFNAIRAVADKSWQNAGFELECSRAIAQKLGKVPDPHKFYVPFEVQGRGLPGRGLPGRRDLTVASASGGGYLVETANMSFVELMRNRSVVYTLGAQRLAGLTGSVTVPKQTGAATAVWLANEASTATESAQTFGQMALSPKTVGAYTEISRQLMLQSSPDAEGIVASDLATVCALAIDVGALRGAGSSGEPQGIVGTAGVGSVSGSSLAAAGILEFQSDVAAGNLLSDSFGYVTTPAVAALLMARPELPSTGTTRLWQGSMLNGSLFGMRAIVSNQMSSATMLAGDFSKVVIAEWGVLEVEVNPYANFQAGIIGVRAMVSIDVGVRYGGAFSYASSIT